MAKCAGQRLRRGALGGKTPPQGGRGLPRTPRPARLRELGAPARSSGAVTMLWHPAPQARSSRPRRARGRDSPHRGCRAGAGPGVKARRDGALARQPAPGAAAPRLAGLQAAAGAHLLRRASGPLAAGQHGGCGGGGD